MVRTLSLDARVSCLPGGQGMAEKKLRRRVTELEMVDALEPIAQELGATLAQLALAWCLKNKNVSAGSRCFSLLLLRVVGSGDTHPFH